MHESAQYPGAKVLIADKVDGLDMNALSLLDSKVDIDHTGADRNYFGAYLDVVVAFAFV